MISHTLLTKPEDPDFREEVILIECDEVNCRARCYITALAASTFAEARQVAREKHGWAAKRLDVNHQVSVRNLSDVCDTHV